MSKKKKVPVVEKTVETKVEPSAEVQQEIILLSAEAFSKKKEEYQLISKDLDEKAQELYDSNKQVFYSNINGLFFQIIDRELEGLKLGNVEILISELSKEAKLRPAVQKRLMELLTADLKSVGYQLTDDGIFVVN